VAVALAVLVAVFAVVVFSRTTWLTLSTSGLTDRQVVFRGELPGLVLAVETAGRAQGDVVVTLNGETVELVPDDRGRLLAPLSSAIDGDNVVVVEASASLPLVDSKRSELTFTVDASGPVMSVPAAVRGPGPASTAVLRGLVDGAVTVSVNGIPAELEPGAFTAEIPYGATEAKVVATDDEGRVTTAIVRLDANAAELDPPRQAVHIDVEDWANPVLREQLRTWAAEHRINAVQLDIKQEQGVVPYESQVPLATAIGAVKPFYDARAAIDELHGLGLRVIGRLVCFLDPKLGAWALDNGKPEYLVQGASGLPLESQYGDAAFTNVANADVRQYQYDLAAEAVALGFDEILYDYVRRPEGDFDAMQFPGLDTSASVAIARFVRDSAALLEPNEVELGVSVFGISATRPRQSAQDVRLLAPLVDYVSPMLYPSHWGPGEYGIADPLLEPGEIVRRSLVDFQAAVAGSGASLVPWLQDFNSRDLIYDTEEVSAQIVAATESGSSGFLLWNPASQYDAAAIPPLAP
jgi:hypothetical protein